jgi:hypothetical protein
VKVDAYSHILPAPYFERMRELAVDPAALKRWLELSALHDVDERLRMMDEFGDGYQQVLTLSSPPIELLAGPAESAADEDGERVAGRVLLVERLGAISYVHLEVGPHRLVAAVPNDAAPQEPGGLVDLRVPPAGIHLFDREGRTIVAPT